MKHIYIFIVFLTMTTTIFGWNLPIFNKTPYGAWVGVEYVGCRTDNVVIPAGKQINVDAKACLVKKIGVALVTKPGNVKKNVYINWEVPAHRDFWATIAQQPNGTFNINADYSQGGIKQDFIKLGQDINKNVGKPLEQAFSKESLEKANKEIKTAFVGLGKDIVKGFVDFGQLFEKQVVNPIVSAGDVIVSKFKECSAVIALGSEWAAKKSAYEAAQGAVLATQQINDADPLQYGVYAAKQAALLGLDAGKLGAEGLAHMVEGIGVVIGGGFNITELLFDVQATDLAQGKLPLFQIKGIFFGKPCQFTFQFDVNNPEKSMEAVVKELIKLVPGV
jgi:hypothetical protein